MERDNPLFTKEGWRSQFDDWILLGDLVEDEELRQKEIDFLSGTKRDDAS